VDAAFIEHGSVFAYEVVGYVITDVFGRSIVRKHRVTPPCFRHDSQKLSVILGDQCRVIPSFNQWGERPLEMLEVEQQSVVIGLSFDFHEHFIGVTMQVAARTFMPGKAMGSFPTESFCNLHGWALRGDSTSG